MLVRQLLPDGRTRSSLGGLTRDFCSRMVIIRLAYRLSSAPGFVRAPLTVRRLLNHFLDHLARFADVAALQPNFGLSGYDLHLQASACSELDARCARIRTDEAGDQIDRNAASRRAGYQPPESGTPQTCDSARKSSARCTYLMDWSSTESRMAARSTFGR